MARCAPTRRDAPHPTLTPRKRLPPHGRFANCLLSRYLHAHCHCYSPGRCAATHGRLVRHATLTAVTTRRHARGRRHTPPISCCHRHWHRIAAVLHAHSPIRSLPPPHAATLAVIATRHHARCHCHTRPLSRCHRHTPQHRSAWAMARMLHVLCTVSRDHCPVRICCR